MNRSIPLQDLMGEFSRLSTTIYNWILERELYNFFRISLNKVPEESVIKLNGEHVSYKDPFESEFKWKDETVLQFKGSVDMLTGHLNVGVLRVFLNSVEPTYYKFEITTDGVKMV